MSEYLLTQVINYGAPLLAIIVLIGGFGVPLPCTVLVIAAGAFARQGILPWHTTAILSLISVVIGDAFSYSLGYYSRDLVLRRFSETPRWLQAEQSSQKWGSAVHFLFALSGDCHCLTRQFTFRHKPLPI